MDTDGEGTCKFIFIFHETIRESYLSHRAIGYCLSEIAYVDTDRYRAWPKLRLFLACDWSEIETNNEIEYV